ncbi:pyridoxal-phosphate dependent enzyme, partial [bacterium]|nr:pyridoxal-phosphate dependent enzyme [bacterium]
MKYRFTLSVKSNELALSIHIYKDECAGDQVGYPITTQIIEDFTTPDYFYTNLIDILKPESFTDGNCGKVFKWPFSERLLDEIISKINAIASPERYGSTGNTYTDLIGRTPLLRLSRITDGCKATVLVKLESLEPNSVKDRTVFSIVSEAIRRGDINEDTEVIEASSGNVAFALSAILKAILNKKPRIYISKMHGETKIRAVRVSGCPVVLTAASEGTHSAKRASVDYAKSHENIFQLNQHGNPDNPRAHRLTTGPEIYHQTHI